MKLKNKPIHTLYNGIKYDSIFEASVAETLQQFVYSDCSISQQNKLSIKPATDFFPAKFWRCDFKVSCKGHDLYIEAKGFADSNFLTVLEMLDYFSPNIFKNLLIVVPNNFHIPSQWKKIQNKIVIKKELELMVKDWVHTAIHKPP